MKTLSLFKLSIMILLLGSVARAQSAIAPFGQGMPLPWPFPWAKECPINWESLEGRYLLSDTDSQELDLKITVIDKMNFKLIRVARYDAAGHVLAEGVALVNNDQKSIRLWLLPRKKGAQPIWAEIKMFYRSSELFCSDEYLVPILTLDYQDKTTHTQAQYRLVRLTH